MGAEAGTGAGAGAAGALDRPARWASMSCLVTRPMRPEPFTWARSTPLSAAMRRTRGLDLVRRRPSRVSASGSGGGTGASGAGAGVTSALAGPPAGGPPAGFSPAAPMRATTVPTGTVAFTSTRISRTVPAMGAGISASTLSVEIS